MKPPTQKRQDWIRGRRQKRKLARQARLRRQIFRYTVLALLVGAGISAFAYLPWSLHDAHRSISIHGNKVASDEQILSMLQAAMDKPLYRVDPRMLERNVCQLPVVKYAFVRRAVLPAPSLRVEVMEEFPWATVSDEPASTPRDVISETGRVIPIAQFPAVMQPPLRICAAPGFKLSAQEIAQWDRWVRLIAEQLGHTVDYVDMRQPTAIAVVCGDIQLHLGQADSSLTRRLSRLASVVPVVATLRDKLAYIDLSLDSNIPLKVQHIGNGSAHEDELLRQAVRAVSSNTPAAPPI